ncbi:amidase [Podospora aff. communis PSN243]|uniref:Amidase n=1 Tax=Podospora aff. communis PSN243 TaxID=3040156 RepID=A0AAV9GT73_9PEZI|nr:amidase [Podospora aff. communis PSN243]
MRLPPGPIPSKAEVELVVTVGEVEYFLIPCSENLLGFPESKAVVLALVYSVQPGNKVSQADLRNFRTNVLDKDDVFQPEFCRNIVFYGASPDEFELERGAKEEIEAWNTKSYTLVNPSVLRPRVIVPSRCYFKPSKSRPIDGARITVKDNIDIAGHKSAAGIASYDWLDFSIGSDTNGSGIKPAQSNGCFSIRPTKTEISLAQQWKTDQPDGPDNDDLAEYLELTGSYPYYYDAYHAHQSFCMEYQEKFRKSPFGHWAMLGRWCGAKMTYKNERDFYWRRSEIYREWLLYSVFKAGSDNCIMIMVLPIQKGKRSLNSRAFPSIPQGPYYILSGYSSLNMSPMMKAPEVTAIVGEIVQHSHLTCRREPLPIAASVIGAPGTDLVLVDVVEKALKAAGMPSEVQTGRFVYGS